MTTTGDDRTPDRPEPDERLLPDEDRPVDDAGAYVDSELPEDALRPVDDLDDELDEDLDDDDLGRTQPMRYHDADDAQGM